MLVICYACIQVVGEGYEALHVKVMKVARDSPARKAGVHCQMYLKSIALSLSDPTTFADAVVIGTNCCRNRVTKGVKTIPEEDPWQPNQDNCVDMDALIASVDSILSKALLQNKIVRAELVEYIIEK